MQELFSNRSLVNRVLFAFIASYIASTVLVNTVFFADAPVVRPEFIIRLADIKSSSIQKILNTKNLIADIPKAIRDKQLQLLPPVEIVSPPSFVEPTQPNVGIPEQPIAPLPPGRTNPTPRNPFNPVPTTSQNPRPTDPIFILPSPTPWQPPPAPPEPPATAPSGAAEQLLGFINTERGKNNALALVFNAKLNKAAQDYANLIGPAHQCSHTYQTSLQQRMNAVGYPLVLIGENITCGLATPQAAFNGWMGSAPHRSNMLNIGFKSAGLGYSSGYWVLDLGAR